MVSIRWPLSSCAHDSLILVQPRGSNGRSIFCYKLSNRLLGPVVYFVFLAFITPPKRRTTELVYTVHHFITNTGYEWKFPLTSNITRKHEGRVNDGPISLVIGYLTCHIWRPFRIFASLYSQRSICSHSFQLWEVNNRRRHPQTVMDQTKNIVGA